MAALAIALDHDAPRLLPRCVFAAGRQSFEVTVFCELSPDEILDEAFETLPLTQYG